MPAIFSQAMIDRTLVPYWEPFVIPVICDKYKVNVSGRVGYFFEDLFGVANNNRGTTPDTTEGELKTYNLSNPRSLNISKFSENEYKNLPTQKTFKNSLIFKKMVRTTLVTYYDVPTSMDDPVYEKAKGTNCDLHRLENWVLDELNDDWRDMSHWMICFRDYKKLTRYLMGDKTVKIGRSPPPAKPESNHLILTWSGSLEYPQPTWKFKCNFTRKYLVSFATNPQYNDRFDSLFSLG